MTRYARRGGKLWIRVFPDKSVTNRAAETRMGSGKGAVDHWVAVVRPGRVLFEIAGVPEEQVQALFTYGDALGIAFQIADDILDVEGDAAQMGKAVGKDAGRGKATFVSLLGMDGAKRRAESLVTEACDCLSVYGSEAGNLQDAARFVISRRT